MTDDTKVNLPILDEKLVCFIDILGFADLVEQASKQDKVVIELSLIHI